MERIRTCVCGQVFKYEIARGRDRKYCSDVCAKEAAKRGQLELNKMRPVCSTVGCDKLATRIGFGLCEGCYMRLRRKGTTDYKPLPPYRSEQSAGYVWLREPGHPLSDSGGLVYEHRFVYYFHNGDGPFNCHWCGKQITWDMMHIDHLDEDKQNNNIENIVASCPICNQRRGDWKKMAKAREKGQITYKGISKMPHEWAADIGISKSAFVRRIELWDIDKAMTIPKGPTGPKPRI